MIAGFTKGLDFVLTGALDEFARTVLGFTEDPPKPLEDYMPLEPSSESEQ